VNPTTLIFQIIAVVVIGVAAVLLFRGAGARHQALRRIFMVLFIAAVASSVFFPQIWTWVANLFGIGRGTDLLVYLMVMAFIGLTATIYRRFRQQERDITELARRLALLDSRKPDAEKRDDTAGAS
jgi:small membrane protein